MESGQLGTEQHALAVQDEDSAGQPVAEFAPIPNSRLISPQAATTAHGI